MSRARSVETLVAGLVDYAGLFPPAAKSMRDAVDDHARYVRGADRAMLGRFVVPVARLAEFAAACEALSPEASPSTDAPWRLAVLAGVEDAPALAAFAHPGVVIDTIEAKAATVDGIAALAAALGARYTVYVELPVQEDPSALIAAVGAHGLRAKLRTGGITHDAFPAPAAVLRFLAACAAQGVPFKATAGLHHPLRGEYPLTYAPDAPRGTMYGFLNIFLTAALLRAGASPEAVAPLLEERDSRAIEMTDDAIVWRGHRLSRAALAAARDTFAGSFGSCSFEEPVHDLATLTTPSA